MSNVKRAAAVAAGLVALAVSAAPALAAAPAPTQRVNLTALTLRVAHSFVAPNQSDTLAATLQAAGGRPVSGATVYLVERKLGARSFGAPVTVATPTDAKGQVTLSVVPNVAKGQIEEYAIVFNGDAAHQGSRSGIVMIAGS